MGELGSAFGPALSPLTRAVTEGGGGGLSAFSAAKYAIQQNAADVNILVIGDSTGTGNDEWTYLFADWLGDQYLTHSVDYRLWNDTNGSYDAATSFSTGTGNHKITVWNAGVAGAQPMFLAGSKGPAAVVAVDASLIIVNHGHNSAVGMAAELQRGEFMSGMEHARLAHPTAAMATFLQNPNRDDSDMAQTTQQMAAVAALYGDVLTIDAYSGFIAAGKPSAWYADNVHPNATGQLAVVVPAIQRAWLASAPSNGATVSAPFLSVSKPNLLSHARFSDALDYTGGTPTGWSASSSPTCAVETTIKDTGSSQSLKITGTTAGARIAGFADAAGVTALKGKKATVAVRAYIPAGSAVGVGRVALGYVVGASTVTTTRATVMGQGAFRWIIIAGVDIPAGATSVFVSLYCDSAANTTSAAYYDRAILVAGDVPRDML